MGDLSESIDDAFKPRGVQNYGKALQGTNQQLQRTEKQAKKTSKSMGKFTKQGGRGISMLSRFGGVGGKATRSFGGLAFALGSTPFGPFALAAAAATAAYSFFSSKLGLNNAEIIKKNKELSSSIDELQGKLGEAFRGRQQAAIDLNIEGLTEAEKLNQKIALEQEFLAKEQLRRQELITENREKQNAAIAAGNKKDTQSLEAKKAFLESELQIEKATKSILATQ